MKKFDFTQTGGFPIVQERLAFMQDGYEEALMALAAIGGDTTGPMRVSGMEITVAGSDYTVTDGWFVYNGELIRFTGDHLTISDTALVEITENATPLTFKNSTTPNVQLEKTATIVDGASTTDATHFPLADLKPWGREAEWTEVTSFVDTYSGTITGSMSYKKCSLTNTLHVRGSLTVTNSANSASWGGALPAYGTSKIYGAGMPDGYKPSADAYLTAHLTVPKRTSADDGWITTVFVGFEADGDVTVQCIKTLADAAYTIKFTGSFSLD